MLVDLIADFIRVSDPKHSRLGGKNERTPAVEGSDVEDVDYATTPLPDRLKQSYRLPAHKSFHVRLFFASYAQL